MNAIFLPTLFLISVVFTSSVFSATELSPSNIHQTPAYQQYERRPKNELSKLIYLMDYFKVQNVLVNYDGYDYDSEKAARVAKNYVAKNFKSGDKAEKWLKIHTYRSQPRGNVIYFKYPDGKRKPMRDVLLKELEILEEIK